MGKIMKVLPEKIRKYGLEHELVTKNNKVFVYKVLPNYGYDVFLRKIYPAGKREINGVEIKYQEAERWPKDEDFGVWAWHFMTLGAAKNKMGELSK